MSDERIPSPDLKPVFGSSDEPKFELVLKARCGLSKKFKFNVNFFAQSKKKSMKHDFNLRC